MEPTKSIESASSAVRKLWEKHGIKEPMRFLGFCLSLLPIPVIQQAGQALDRHLSDKSFEKELDSIWAEINKNNSAASSASTIEQSIHEIAIAVSSNEHLAQITQAFLSSLGASQKEFLVLTENKSYQEIVNSLIKADISTFSAQGGSTNVIANSQVQSERTVLHATDTSRNIITGTSFQGTGGSISMDNISATGPITLQGSSVGFGVGGSIGFGPGGALRFGGNPNEVTANCPGCGFLLKADRTQLEGFTSIQCPSCKGIFPFAPPGA